MSTEKKVSDDIKKIAEEKSIEYLDAVMEYCKRENKDITEVAMLLNDELKKELANYSARL